MKTTPNMELLFLATIIFMAGFFCGIPDKKQRFMISHYSDTDKFDLKATIYVGGKTKKQGI